MNAAEGLSFIEKLILLRHACAGEKLPDAAKDFERGLDAEGEAIAARLPEAVTTRLRPNEILSSPFRRCVQTVRPLATALGVRVREDERLAPERTSDELRQILVQLPANSVVCTHGEVIERLFEGAVTCAKGGFWIIERHDDGRLVPAHYVAAP